MCCLHALKFTAKHIGRMEIIMVKHVVMWNLKDEFKSQENLNKMQQGLKGLVGTIPGLKSVSFGKGFSGYDACLISEHDDKQAVEVYQKHPAHLEVATFIRSIVEQRASCDFEIE